MLLLPSNIQYFVQTEALATIFLNLAENHNLPINSYGVASVISTS